MNSFQGYASKAETEASIKNIERKINNLFKMQMQSAFSLPSGGIDFHQNINEDSNNEEMAN